MKKNDKNQVLENQKYINEKLVQKKAYTIEEAKKIAKDALLKFYNSLK